MSSTPIQVEATLRSPEMIEALAAIEHERWAHWQAYLHGQCELLDDGSLRIPAELAERWTRQIQTRFEDLTEQEKESDRDQVREYLSVISRSLLGDG